MSLHLGLHWTMILGMLRRLCKTVHSPRRTLILRCISSVISGCGIVFFVRNRLTDYLLLRTHFVMLDWNVTLTSFLLQYLCLMGLFVCAGYYLGKAMQSIGINTEFHVYPGLSHGFGLGTGTVAEGWLDDAVTFWKKQM